MRAKITIIAAIALATWLSQSAPAVAQTTSTGTGTAAESQSSSAAESLQEIVITAPYKQELNSSSMKMGIPVRDTPFSIESYSPSFLKSIETVQIADLYRYMTGLQKAGNTGYDLTIRGFSTTDLDRDTFMTDGLPGLAVRFGSPPTIGIDHIELVKGTTSLLYGQATPGGFVNIITKKPQATPLTQFETRGTTNASDFSRVRGGDFSFDSTGPLGAGDRVLYRVIGQLSDDRYFRDLSYLRGQYIAPSMSFKLGTATIATIQFEYRKASADYDNVELLAPDTAVAATVAQLAPIHTNYAAPGTSRDERGTSTTVFLDHGFSGGAVWHLDMRSVDHHDYATAYDIGPFDKADPTLQTLDLRARGQSNQRTYNFADSNVVVPFLTGSVAHRVIFGLNYGKEIDDFKRRQFCTLNTLTKRDPKCDPTTTPHTIAVINPDFSIVPSLATFGPGSLADNYIVSQTEAAYVSDLLTLTDHWKSFLGLRYSHDKVTANINSYDPTQPYYSQTRSSTVPAVGLIFQPDSHWSYYASYTTSYSPVDPSTTAPTTAPTFKPVEGKGEEVGVKANFMNGRLDFTGALFRIDEKNILAPYPGGTDQFCPTGSCSIQVGGARSKGVELELNAKPIDALTLIAGYAYTDARVTDSTAGGPLVGHQLPNSPLNAAHLWARYDVLDGLMRGFGAGLGFSAVSARVAMTGTSTLPGEFILPSYQVVDLGLYKVFSQHLDLTLKINNVFDKLYYQSGKITSGMVNVSAGLPRTIELYLHASF